MLHIYIFIELNHSLIKGHGYHLQLILYKNVRIMMTDKFKQMVQSCTFTLHLIYLLSYLHFVRVRKEDGLLYTVYKLLEITISKKKTPTPSTEKGKNIFHPTCLKLK